MLDECASSVLRGEQAIRDALESHGVMPTFENMCSVCSVWSSAVTLYQETLNDFGPAAMAIFRNELMFEYPLLAEAVLESIHGKAN